MFEDSTHGGRQNWWLRYPTFLRTSTHALTEGDAVLPGMYRRTAHFNSRPHGGRPHAHLMCTTRKIFQLTPSRRATPLGRKKCLELVISTHALTEGDSAGQCDLHLQQGISTHALTEGDRTRSSPFSMLSEFQLTPSRRATVSTSFPHHQIIFQLTPSRRATPTALQSPHWSQNFNSRPHGGRLSLTFDADRDKIFQLTPSRRATSVLSMFLPPFLFQLTPSRRATANLDKFFF